MLITPKQIRALVEAARDVLEAWHHADVPAQWAALGAALEPFDEADAALVGTFIGRCDKHVGFVVMIRGGSGVCPVCRESAKEDGSL